MKPNTKQIQIDCWVPYRSKVREEDSQSVSYFTVPPRAHPSTGSQSGSATPGRTQVVKYRELAPGGHSIVASEAQDLSQSVSQLFHGPAPRYLIFTRYDGTTY